MSEADDFHLPAFPLPNDPTPSDEAVYVPSVTPSHARSVYDGIHNGRWTRPLPQGVGTADLNFLDPANKLFRISHVMSSAGQALDQVGPCIITQRDRTTTRLICDSGGYQIATGVRHINGDGDRLQILQWQERYANLAITLDVPPGPVAAGMPGYRFNSVADCLKETLVNLDFIQANRRVPEVQFLNVLQGNSPQEADAWYDAVKNYPFEGWAIAGPLRHNMFELTRRILIMLDEGKLGDRPRWIHILGTAELDAAVMLTALQGALNDIGARVRISFDTSGPFLTLAMNQVYTLPYLTDTKMVMSSVKAPDGRAFVGTQVRWPWPSPIGGKMVMGDFCVPSPQGGRRFRDSLSYALQANHNLAALCFGIAQANRVFKAESIDHNHTVGSREGAAVQAIKKAISSQSLGVLAQQRETFNQLRRTNPDEGRDTIPDPE